MTKTGILAILGTVGGAIASVFGGWDDALLTLMILMGVDYLTGVIVAGVFHKSKKSESGALESRAGWKGLCRKGLTLLIVLVACRLDVMLHTDFVRDAVVIAFCANEALSIVENAGLMGVPIPKVILRAIEVLKSRGDAADIPDEDAKA
ncbi:MAG: phage holin family protein [Oscillospiraceae bacterium]|nr:phage holin family protein [Oscillospiraceae bacterium]